MSLIIGVLASFCFLAALPVTFFLLHFLTKPSQQTSTTQTGKLLYAELSCGDSEHLPYVQDFAISDAVVLDDIEERKARIANKEQTPTLTPKRKTEKAKPIRSLADREETVIDHTLEIIE